MRFWKKFVSWAKKAVNTVIDRAQRLKDAAKKKFDDLNDKAGELVDKVKIVAS